MQVPWEGDAGDFLFSIIFSQKIMFIPHAEAGCAEDAVR